MGLLIRPLAALDIPQTLRLAVAKFPLRRNKEELAFPARFTDPNSVKRKHVAVVKFIRDISQYRLYLHLVQGSHGEVHN